MTRSDSIFEIPPSAASALNRWKLLAHAAHRGCTSRQLAGFSAGFSGTGASDFTGAADSDTAGVGDSDFAGASGLAVAADSGFAGAAALAATGASIRPVRFSLDSRGGTLALADQVLEVMADLGVAKTHSRPYVSNDNPYSESQFRTLKYRLCVARTQWCLKINSLRGGMGSSSGGRSAVVQG